MYFGKKRPIPWYKSDITAIYCSAMKIISMYLEKQVMASVTF